MLTISTKQIKLLDDIMLKRFVSDLYLELNAEEIIPERHNKETEIERINTVVVRSMKRYDIETMDALDEITRLSYKYPELMSGKNWHPEVDEILSWPDRPVDRKLILIKKYLENVTRAS